VKSASKADACPKCGVRLKAKPPGCIVGFFKLIGGIVGAIVGLMVAISFLSSGDKRDPVQELESSCRALSDSYSIESERPTVYSSCVASGSGLESEVKELRSKKSFNEAQTKEWKDQAQLAISLLEKERAKNGAST